MRLEFSENGYAVSTEGVSIELLPKEYALLQFLSRNQGQAFSREQLLDRVWPREYPVERTVDDHIYRLRKKLAPLDGVEIRTVRGFGYVLTIGGGVGGDPGKPSAQDGELQEQMREIFVKYHRYGQGKSMLALARQQDVLGFELDPFYAVYTRFVQGDVQWLLDGGGLKPPERLYWLLLFFLFAGKPEESLAYCERALADGRLPESQHREVELLNILDLYAASGRPEAALERLRHTRERIARDPGFKSFETPAAVSELYARLYMETDDERLQALEARIERLLAEQPFLREIGSFQIVSGLRRLRAGDRKAGEARIDEGLGVLDISGFVPIKLFGLFRIVQLCRQMPVPGAEAAVRRYERQFAEESARCGLPGLLSRIGRELEAGLQG
ncbi:winged helix-turn-helix domain-containing protein [Paenibacillus pasadenensis]|uniref:winged helix-turn-helix domain-containing protein n=1 Tax=Paenibacillus pasadenensis TaxID=217090 RepID=UPI0004071C42|nr:winged helix-turn-helix domain-containing protein [Paenibacillus pasadenensis]